MAKVLRPERFDADPSSNLASKQWLYWERTFVNFLSVLPRENLDQLTVLANFVSATVFQHIEECVLSMKMPCRYWNHFSSNPRMRCLLDMSWLQGE